MGAVAGWLCLFGLVPLSSSSRPHLVETLEAKHVHKVHKGHSKKGIEDDFLSLTKNLDEYAALLQNAKTASQSAEVAAKEFAAENPKDFKKYQHNVQSAAREAAQALEKANAQLKKEDEDMPREALKEAAVE